VIANNKRWPLIKSVFHPLLLSTGGYIFFLLRPILAGYLLWLPLQIRCTCRFQIPMASHFIDYLRVLWVSFICTRNMRCRCSSAPTTGWAYAKCFRPHCCMGSCRGSVGLSGRTFFETRGFPPLPPACRNLFTRKASVGRRSPLQQRPTGQKQRSTQRNTEPQ